MKVFLRALFASCAFFMLGAVASEKTPPKLSIITSIWNGDEFIAGFLQDITSQTIFSECELILVNANSPGHEEKVIEPYLSAYPNIRYVRLDHDPGVYGVWNRAIKMAKGEYLTNANLDDRSRKDAYEVLLAALEADPSVDLVYSGFYRTNFPNETFENNRHYDVSDPLEFSSKNMQGCLPGPRPVWRKSFHDRFGFFDESFISSGDFAMWLRGVCGGSKFKKVPGILTLYYLNPKGISTEMNTKREKQRALEEQLIFLRYGHLWTQER